ncbi:polysaccharide biosynthesis tyrosine autokinase [Algibacter sp. L4_22]|uniref:polysaccharide biosynthesis tyrosine autokinase n=1 Tax=Algibacter sp. L4_22 TaxID=2942477 RepID=UPI00201B50CF|nr:polysaccharide biosynthesis tyrosine autokinase [Algibacter sp. L4_22]MCL5128759.1 polysaccharide biosynthesis tyrosine autokinase [Algibacter sp. L4_22]
MEDGFDFQNGQNFDFKEFVFRALSYWKWFLLGLCIVFYVVYYQNIRREFPYTLGASITVQDDKNPLFTATTSLVFNYGGISGKVQEVLLNLTSRKHHEKVVDSLKLYITYLKQGRFYKTDIYKQAPFEFEGKIESYQIIGHAIKITFLNENSFQISYDFGELEEVVLQNFQSKDVKTVNLSEGILSETYNFGDYIDLPFLKGRIIKREQSKIVSQSEYFIRFNNFDSTVSSFIQSYIVRNESNSPLLTVRLTNKNKPKIVDYINTSIFILDRDQLQRKNQYAINTIEFIDKQLSRVKGELTKKADSLNDFMRTNKIFDIESESALLTAKIEEYKDEKELFNEQLLALDLLKNYLNTNNDYSDLQVPSTTGISEGNIGVNVSKIVLLSAEKSKLAYSVRNNVSVFDDLNRQIGALKLVVLENIASEKFNIQSQLKALNSKIYNSEREFSTIPESQQRLRAIEREYLLSQSTYDLYLAKRGEADLIKASNVSDIVLIEPAKDTGQGRNAVNLNIRYVFAFFTVLIPVFLVAFIVTFFDNKLHAPGDLEKLSSIPLLGVIGQNDTPNNLAVFNKSQSAMAEAFRAIRSSLQFMYKKHDLEGSKTVLVTSSISGEGKTFTAINIASVFALSGKRTVLVGLDLRKPKIFDDFELKNEIGVVNHLIGQKSLSEIVQHTKVENLDIITSGPIPPNPSELLISATMDNLIAELKTKYDYIILDTPPVGLVADALELLEYADASLYVVRQDYTQKDMLTLINEKHKNGVVKNISFIYNFYNLKGKYGYGYGYGYGDYANGYHDKVEKKSFFNNLISKFKK